MYENAQKITIKSEKSVIKISAVIRNTVCKSLCKMKHFGHQWFLAW